MLTADSWDLFFNTHQRKTFLKQYSYKQFETLQTLITNLSMTFSKVCDQFRLNGSVEITTKWIIHFFMAPNHGSSRRNKSNANTSTVSEEEEITDNRPSSREKRAIDAFADFEEEITENNPSSWEKRASYRSGWSYIVMPEELLYVLGFDGPGTKTIKTRVQTKGANSIAKPFL